MTTLSTKVQRVKQIVKKTKRKVDSFMYNYCLIGQVSIVWIDVHVSFGFCWLVEISLTLVLLTKTSEGCFSVFAELNTVAN